jgi:hypothetical protein
MYRQMGPDQRRLLNQAFFEKVHIDDGEVTGHVLTEPFGEIVEGQQAVRDKKRPKTLATPASSASSVNPFLAIYEDRGSSKTVMVGVEGLEPHDLLVVSHSGWPVRLDWPT